MMRFWQTGYSGVSHAKVIAEMGIGRQSAYDTYGSRQALFAKAFAMYAEERVPVIGALQADGAGLAALRRHFHGSVAFFCSHPELPACLVTRTMLEGEADVRALGTALKRELEDGFRNCLSNAARDGTLREGVSPVAAARAAALLWHGIGVEAAGGAQKQELLAAVDAVFDAWQVPSTP